jgi:threonine dehydratase
VGLEILRQHAGRLDAIFLPVGGGGLIAGVGAYVKRLRPHVKIIGVQPVDSDAMRRSLEKGERVRLAHVGVFADGVAVKYVGEETFRLCRAVVDQIILVDGDDICAAIKDVFEETRSILEPAGALAVAGLKRYAETANPAGQTWVAVNSGANMNFERLRFVAERAEMGEHREALFAVTIPERPGSFRAFCRLLGPRNVTEFNYRFADASVAHVFVGVRVSGRAESAAVLDALRQGGLSAVDLTDDETAKLHVRYLVGGRAPAVNGERLLRFEFPERPGALMNFLERMNAAWNITLFHYRNQGADYGRVLIGLHVPAGEEAAFTQFLDALGYAHEDESDNLAYALFLR